MSDLEPFDRDEMLLARAAIAKMVEAQVGAGKDAVRRMYAKLAMVLPHRDKSEQEEAFVVEVYADCLQDVPLDVLHAAFRKITNSQRFFPSVAEIRAACTEQHRRAWVISRLRAMVARGERSNVVEIARPEDVARIKAEVVTEFATRRDAQHAG